MAKQKAIDGSSVELVPYDVPVDEENLYIGFVEADDLEALEEGVRKLGQGVDVLALYQGLGILKIEREGLWRQAGFQTLRAYREAQGERLGMPRQTISRRRKVAEGYEDNRRMLQNVSLEGRVEKLALLNRALRIHEKRDVLAHFKVDSYRDFALWISPRKITPGLPDVDLRVDGDSIILDGDELLELSGALPEEEKIFVAATLKAAYRARAGNLVAHVIGVYDASEARWLEKTLREHRANK
jgi:hypothetical protein